MPIGTFFVPQPLIEYHITLVSQVQILAASLNFLILILLEPKVISLCHQYRARSVCTSVQSPGSILLADQLQVTKMIMGGSKNGRVKMLRVK